VEKPNATRGILLTPLVPVTAVGLFGYSAYDASLAGVVGFGLVWSIFIYPVALAGGALAHLLLSVLKLEARRHYFLLWFASGATLVGGWFSQSGEFLAIMLFALVGGIVGGLGGLTFWHLTFGRAAGPSNHSLVGKIH